MPREVICWRTHAPEIDVLRLLRVHKYNDPHRIRPVILKAAQKAISSTQELAFPEVHYCAVAVKSLKDGVLQLENGRVFSCAAFDERLTYVTDMIIFIATLGAKLDTTISEGFAAGTDPLGPLFMDTAGWLMIEAITREFSASLKSDFDKQGRSLSMRMAPGYDYAVKGSTERASWDLSEQSELFACFEGTKLPVIQLESGAMLPRMSRSGVYGVSPKTSGSQKS